MGGYYFLLFHLVLSEMVLGTQRNPGCIAFSHYYNAWAADA